MSNLASIQTQLGSQSHLALSPTPSTFRANSYPEDKNPICQLPLPTFIYRLEAVHLLDVMRVWVRSGGRSIHGLHHGFQGPTRMHGHRSSATVFGRLTFSLCGGVPWLYLPCREKKTFLAIPSASHSQISLPRMIHGFERYPNQVPE